MKRAYRGQSILSGCLAFFAIIFGIAAQLYVGYLCFPYQKQLQGWILPICAIPLLLVFLAIFWVNRRRQKARLASIAVALEAEGIHAFPEPSPELRAELTPHVDALKGPFQLSGSVANVVWLAYNDQLFLFEHAYTTGSGKSTVEHVRTVVAWPRGSSSRVDTLCDRPWLIAARAGMLEARALRSDLGEDLEIGEPTFDGKWSIFGDVSTASALFTSGAREQAEAAGKGERWSIGAGWVACGTPLALDAANVIAFVRYAESVVRG